MEDPSPDDAGRTTVRRSSHAGRDEGGSRTLRRSAGGCTKRLGAAGTRGTMWKTASASPPSGGRPRLVAGHTHKEPCTHRTGGDLFPFTHLTVEVSVFIYLSRLVTASRPTASTRPCATHELPCAPLSTFKFHSSFNYLCTRKSQSLRIRSAHVVTRGWGGRGVCVCVWLIALLSGIRAARAISPPHEHETPYRLHT